VTQQGKPQTGDRVGHGVLFPLRFVGNDFETGSGFELVKSSTEIIIGASAASEDGETRGEFRANKRLGTQLRRYVHKNIRGIWLTVIRAAGLEGLTELEPRVILDPGQFSIAKTLDRRMRVRIGIRTDPAYTGESKGGTAESILEG
jgi:phage baseplate assembly protein W